MNAPATILCNRNWRSLPSIPARPTTLYPLEGVSFRYFFDKLLQTRPCMSTEYRPSYPGMSFTSLSFYWPPACEKRANRTHKLLSLNYIKQEEGRNIRPSLRLGTTEDASPVPGVERLFGTSFAKVRYLSFWGLRLAMPRLLHTIHSAPTWHLRSECSRDVLAGSSRPI